VVGKGFVLGIPVYSECYHLFAHRNVQYMCLGLLLRILPCVSVIDIDQLDIL
jgi:hypothetical protein